MSGKFLIGQLVRVKDDAFAGSSCAEDRAVRGHAGTIRECIRPDRRYYKVDVEDLGLYFLRESELEAAE